MIKRRSSSKFPKQLIKSLFYVIIIFFLWKTFFSNFTHFNPSQFNIKPLPLLVAAIFFELSYIFYSLSWNEIVKQLNVYQGIIYPFIDVGRTILARYAPAGDVVAKTLAITKHNPHIPRISAISGVLLQHLFLYIASIAIFIPLIIKNPLIVLSIYACIILLLYWRNFLKVIASIVNRFSKYNISTIIGFSRGEVFLYSAGFFICQGTFSYMLLGIGHNIPLYDFIRIMSLAWFTGQISSVPGGLGIREGVTVMFLQSYMPYDIAMQSTILLRLGQLVFEVLYFIQSLILQAVFNRTHSLKDKTL